MSCHEYFFFLNVIFFIGSHVEFLLHQLWKDEDHDTQVVETILQVYLIV